MRIEESHGVTRVFLSRRNLQVLLAKLDGAPMDSKCTIGAPGNVPVFVTAEENDTHYDHPDQLAAGIGCAPGEMHPDTEAAL